EQGRPAVAGRGARSRECNRHRAWLEGPLVPGLGHRARRHLADHARGDVLLRPPEARSPRGRRKRRQRGIGCNSRQAAYCAGGHGCGALRHIAASAHEKTRPGAGFFVERTALDQAAAFAALMRAFRRALWRAALFLWIRPRELNRSRIGWAILNASSAATTSFWPRALRTLLTEVRSIERWLAWRALRTTVCLARFLADLMLATIIPGRLCSWCWKS